MPEFSAAIESEEESEIEVVEEEVAPVRTKVPYRYVARFFTRPIFFYASEKSLISSLRSQLVGDHCHQCRRKSDKPKMRCRNKACGLAYCVTCVQR